MLRLLLLFMVAMPVVPLSGETPDLPAPSAPTTPPAITIGLLPDRTGGPAAGLSILRRAIGDLNELAPDFVVNIGDMLQGYTWSPEHWIAEAREYQEAMKDLQCPWYPTVGNHDVFPGLRGARDRTNESLYKQHIGPLWYSYSFRGAHFIHLDSETELTGEPAFGEEQMNWLANDLIAKGDAPTFVFLHKPAWAYGQGEIWEPIHELLTKHGCVAVFAGHFHAYQKCEPRDGIAYYILGAAGGYVHKPELGGGLQHTCVLTIRGREFKLALIRVGGVEADDFVTRADYVRLDANGDYGNRSLSITGELPVPTPTAGAHGTVIVHLANKAREAIDVSVTMSSEPPSGWRLDQPITRTLAAGEEVDVEVALSADPCAGPAALPPTLLVHFPVTDSKGRVVDLTRKLRVALARRARADAATAAVLRCDDWFPDYKEQPGDAVPIASVSVTATTFELHVAFKDSELASYPDERPREAVLSDSLRIDCAETSLLVFPFATGDPKSRFWLRQNEPGWVQTEGVRVEGGYDAKSAEWSLKVSVDRQTLGIAADATETPFNLSIYDNDFTGFTTTYAWMPKDRADGSTGGVLELRAK